MKTLKTLILISSLAGTVAFAQPVNCPEGTKLVSNDTVSYCVKSSDGRLDSTPYVAQHKNGKVHAKGQFVNGKRVFFDKDGNVLEEQNWKAGNREGEQVKFEKGERKVRQFKADRLVK